MTRGGSTATGRESVSLPRGNRMPRSARREQLLRAAQEVFVAQGYYGAAMDDIADRAGISKPVLYQHFPGKLELYLALLDTQIDALIQRIRSALAATTDNRLRVEGAVAAYFDFVDSKSEAFRLLFESDLRGDPAVRERVRAFLLECVSATAVTIAEDTGAPPARAHLLSSGLTGLAEMSARWWLEHRDTVDKAEAVELMSALAWRGISGFPLQEHGPAPSSRTDGSPTA
ncbi:MAG: TetR/AcrR family transcriptional regulator [Actinomycetota bacterium]|nr:TetR/AcrR family transcriptional regulator [Actinomycetota bacterium]